MEQRLIDANRLQLEVDKFFRDECRVLYDLTSLISVMPTVDAVHVVRCGRCKWGKAYKAWDGQAGFKCELLCVDIGVNEFCSYGERRDSDG